MRVIISEYGMALIYAVFGMTYINLLFVLLSSII